MNTMNNTIIYSDSDTENEYNPFQLDEENYDNLNQKKKSENISLKHFNIWDNFLCDHIDDQYIYTEIFKFMNIKTLLNLRLGNKMLNNLITDYFNYLKNNELLNKVKDSHYESLCNMIETDNFCDKENKIRYYNKENKMVYKYIINKHINNIQENTIVNDEENIYKTISLKLKFINKLMKPKNKQIKYTLLKKQKKDTIQKSIQIRRKWVRFILYL